VTVPTGTVSCGPIRSLRQTRKTFTVSAGGQRHALQCQSVKRHRLNRRCRCAGADESDSPRIRLYAASLRCHGVEEIIRFGDPIDVDSNGPFDDHVLFGGFKELGGWGTSSSLPQQTQTPPLQAALSARRSSRRADELIVGQIS
jgi:hypothetical protein